MEQETKKTAAQKGMELSQAKEALQQKNEELETAKSAVEKAEKARDIFLANMSHELRTPINTILGLNELILRESQEEAVKEYARDIRQAGNILLALVSDILDFSKLEADKMDLTEGIYDVSSLLNDLINSISVQLRRKKLDLVLEIAQDIPYKLFGDEIHIRQIIGNLLSNAVRYTEKGRVTLHVSWKELPKDSVEMYVIVKDTGIGIKDEDIPKLFRAFQRMDSATRSKEDRTGLGLAITQRLVEMMGGRLEVQSVYGKGSAFSFRIIQKIVDREPLGDFEKQYKDSLRSIDDYHEKFIAPMGRILIVDDNAMNLAVAQGLLKGTRLQIDVAASGEECLELIKRKTYHLICMDHMMPVMDGIEAAEIIRRDCGENGAAPAIIALTANAMEGMQEQFLRRGFQDFIAKPLDRQELGQLLARWIPEDRRQAGEGSGGSADLGAFRIEGIDTAAAARYYSGDETGFAELLELYYLDGQQKKALLRELSGSSDLSRYCVEVHGLKSASANIGAMRVSELARGQEQAANQGDAERIAREFPALLDAYETLLANIGLFLDRRHQNIPQEELLPALPLPELREQAIAALDALENFRSRECAGMVEAMLRHVLPQDAVKRLREIQEQLLLYEDDHAEELLRQLLSELDKEEETNV